MKKAAYVFITALTLVSVLVACGKKDSDDGNGGGAAAAGGTYAQTPTANCNVPGAANCNPGAYSQFPAFTPYQWTNTNGFCGCPQGSRPVMNPQWGMSCAPDNYFPNQFGYQFQFQTYSYNQVRNWDQYSQNGQMTNTPVVNYAPAISGQNAGCYAQAAAVCDVRSPNTCAAGSTCRASAGGSYLGFCTAGYGNETYSHPQQNCYYKTKYGRWGFWYQVYVCDNSTSSNGYYSNGYSNGYGQR